MAGGLDENFAIHFQKQASVKMYAIDYSFNVSLKNLAAVLKFRRESGS